MRKPIALVAALLLTTSVLAACGDDGDDDASTSVEDGGSATESTDDTTDSTDDTSDTTDTTVAGGEDPSTTTVTVIGANPDSPFCDAARTFAGDDSLATGDFSPETTAHAVELLTSLRDAAPDEIKDDLQVVIDGYAQLATAMEEAGDDPAAQQAAVASLGDSLDELNTASLNVQAFTEQECGTDVAGGNAEG